MSDRPYHHGDLRAVLLAGAERALGERGPAALSLRELAREAGVSHAAPGRHFKDKQALLDALALHGFDLLNARMERAAAASADGGDDVRNRLLTAARVYVDFAIEHAALLDLMYTVKHATDVSEQISAAVIRLHDSVERPIVAGQAAGEIAPGDPATLAMTVAATLHGFAAFNATNTSEDIDANLAAVMHVLFEGFAPR